jgi:DNA-binding Lrp family transcriptional regulator
MGYKKGELAITDEEILPIVKQEGAVTANIVAKKLTRHFFTARKKMEEMVSKGTLQKIQYVPNKNTIRLYKMRETENEPAEPKT